jgi:heme-degrading monooxygenase HmoA
MVIEIATLFVKDEAEGDFVGSFGDAAEILKRQPGCRGLRWGKRVEPDLAFVLEVEWDQIEDHFGFRETDDYKSFGALFRDFLSKPPEVVHFHPAD